MWNKPSKERLAQIPGLYETEKVPLQEKIHPPALFHRRLRLVRGRVRWPRYLLGIRRSQR